MKSVLLHGLLALACFGLVRLDRALSDAEVSRRATMGRVGRLLDAGERTRLVDTRFAIVEPGGVRFEFVLRDGYWRIPAASDAIAKASAVKAVLDSVRSVEGVIRTRDADVASALGFATPIVLELAAADGSPVVAVELGASFSEPAGCYARRVGTDTVFQLDEDLASLVRRPAGSAALPLADVALVPEGWPGEGRQWKQLQVQRFGTRFELTVREKKITDEEMRQGVSPFEWIVVSGGTTTVAAQAPASMYATFASRAPYAAIVERAAVADAIATPVAIVRHFAEPGEPLELRIGKPLPDGRVPVENSATGLVMLVSAEVAELLAPSAARLTSDTDGQEWAKYLK
ncbi:MAG: hypothetical protein IT453_00005 [Planctomycetes bacterium]|nr:hypothetical protein [Planctomycetota bacterium]MCC6405513.1 hypothetical protein [Planctomycetota bacterium]